MFPILVAVSEVSLGSFVMVSSAIVLEMIFPVIGDAANPASISDLFIVSLICVIFSLRVVSLSWAKDSVSSRLSSISSTISSSSTSLAVLLMASCNSAGLSLSNS